MACFWVKNLLVLRSCLGKPAQKWTVSTIHSQIRWHKSCVPIRAQQQRPWAKYLGNLVAQPHWLDLLISTQMLHWKRAIKSPSSKFQVNLFIQSKTTQSSIAWQVVKLWIDGFFWVKKSGQGYHSCLWCPYKSLRRRSSTFCYDLRSSWNHLSKVLQFGGNLQYHLG